MPGAGPACVFARWRSEDGVGGADGPACIETAARMQACSADAPSMWIVSRLMVMPFQPRRIAPACTRPRIAMPGSNGVHSRKCCSGGRQGTRAKAGVGRRCGAVNSNRWGSPMFSSAPASLSARTESASAWTRTGRVARACSAVGVTVGSLKMEHNLAPAETASRSTCVGRSRSMVRITRAGNNPTWSSVSSRLLHERSKNSHFDVSTCGVIHFALKASSHNSATEKPSWVKPRVGS